MHLRRPLLLALAALALVSSAASAQCPAYLLKWGAQGTGFGLFRFPQGPSLAPNSEVYVADSQNNRIQRFTPSGTFISAFGTLGAGNANFNLPVATDIDQGTGHVYVADQQNNRIKKHTATGTFVTAWAVNFPSDVAVDPVTGDVIVTELLSNLVKRFSSAGAFQFSWGGTGIGNGQFRNPSGVTVDPSGDIYVTDQANNRVQKFTPGGVFMLKWGTPGAGNGQFSRPVQPAYDGAGGVYVSDPGNHRIQLFTTGGVFMCSIGSLGVGDGQFNTPFGVAASSSSFGVHLVVADRVNHRMQHFGDLATPAPSITWGRLKTLYH